MRRVNIKQRSMRLGAWIFLVVLAGFGLLVDTGRGQKSGEEAVAAAVDGAQKGKPEQVPTGQGGPFAGKVLVIPVRIEDMSDSRRFRSFREMIEQAEDAVAIIFDLNVNDPGEWTSKERLLEGLPETDRPTFAFVNPSALGAGSLLAIGTDAIYMTSAGIIGGSGLYGGEEIENEEAYRRANSQHLSVAKARSRSLAIANGYRPKLVEAFIDADIEVKIGDEVISPKGEILTLTADEAVRIFEGKPLLAKAMATDIDDLLKQEGIVAGIVRQTPLDFLEKKNQSRLSGGSRSSDKQGAAVSDATALEPGLFDRRLESSYEGQILVIKVGADDLATGEARFDFMERTLRKASDDRASAIIFEMDTPGGYAWYTQGLVLNVLQDVTVPTFTFVNTRAESAGAIIAMGTDTIYMRPAATIGSALTVTATGDIEGDMKSKVDQMAVAMARNIAALKGHNPDIAEAFVVRTKEVKVNGEVIHPAGEVLNLNTLRATEEYGGRPLLAKGIVNSVEELVEKEGLKGEIVTVEPLGMERFAHLVQKFSGLLLLVGLAGAWAELKVPGFGVPGVISLLAFSLFFFGNNLAGNLAGYELAVLLVVGLALLAVEIFIVPGTLIAGFVGGVMIIAALVLAMVDRVDFGAVLDNAPSAPAIGDLIFSPVLNVCIALVGSAVLVYFLLRYLPNTPGMRWMVLSQSVAGGASLDANRGGSVSTAGEPARPGSLLGEQGEAVTDLRPAGKGKFGDRLVDISADGEFIVKGTAVRVVRHEGALVVVEAVS